MSTLFMQTLYFVYLPTNHLLALKFSAVIVWIHRFSYYKIRKTQVPEQSLSSRQICLFRHMGEGAITRLKLMN